ncbi:DUF2997 domain-containing protein [Egbenema bharatensis]|uniref:DUF2997 domain-containing protein n=1 Tax=Egbenema bharatensis TaxID=3463334 RepID=UPI003A8A70D8
MTEYQRIEYRIGKDGTVTETVLSASADRCLEATAGIEQALGRVETREQLQPDSEDGEVEEIAARQTIGESGF